MGRLGTQVFSSSKNLFEQAVEAVQSELDNLEGHVRKPAPSKRGASGSRQVPILLYLCMQHLLKGKGGEGFWFLNCLFGRDVWTMALRFCIAHGQARMPVGIIAQFRRPAGALEASVSPIPCGFPSGKYLTRTV